MQLQTRWILPKVISLCLALQVSGAGVTAQLRPNPILVGERGELVLSADGDSRLAGLPDVEGIEWLNTSPSVTSSIRIVNGRRTARFSSTYAFRATKPGRHNFPSLAVSVGSQAYKTGPMTLVATRREHAVGQKKVPLSDLIYMKIAYNGSKDPPTTLYAGQELRLTVTLYVYAGLEVARSFKTVRSFFPVAKIDNGVFREYELKEADQSKSKFLYRHSEQTIDGKRFDVYLYQGTVSPIVPGEMSGTLTHSLPIIESRPRRPTRRDPFNDFFSFGPRRPVVEHKLEAKVAPIKVLPLPRPADQDGHYLGLMGLWEVQFKTDKEEVAAGAAVELRLRLRGRGNIQNLTAPELTVPGFTVYTPKVVRRPDNDMSEAEIVWVLVPRRAGLELGELSFATFDPETGAYMAHRFAPKLVVTPGQEQPGATGQRFIDNGGDGELLPAAKTARAEDILYIKKDLGAGIVLPLWRNAVLGLCLGVAGGPLLYLLVLLLAGRREKLMGSASFRRRQEALKRRGSILRELRGAAPEQVPELVRTQVVPYLLALFELPPGATTAELLEVIDDPELVDILKQAEQNQFMPGAAGRLDVQQLLAKLGKLTMALVCFALVASARGDSLAGRAAAAYDQGKAAEAQALYRQALAAGQGNANVYYNLGNCAYVQGRLGRAVAAYERARRLKPRDSDIVENLNFVRGKLGLPPVAQADTPLALLRITRDKLRPDEWLLLAACLWAVVWAGLALGRWRRRRPFAILVLPSLLLLLAIAAPATQWRSVYARNQGVIVAPNTPLARLPGNGEQAATRLLDAGVYVTIAERRSEWTRVRLDQADGWVRNEALAMIWE